MISKGIFGATFGGALNYVADSGRGVTGYITGSGHRVGALHFRNLSATSVEAAAREMTIVARRSARVKKPVLHAIFSLHPSESVGVDPKKLIQAASKVLSQVGLASHQAVYAVHLEKNHMHCHVVVNRVGPEGKAWEAWRSAMRLRDACRRVEREMGFTPHEVHKARSDRRNREDLDFASNDLTVRQARIYERTGKLPKSCPTRARKSKRAAPDEELRQKVAEILKGGASWSEVQVKLRKAGLAAALYENASRRGLILADRDGRQFPASSFGSDCGLTKLERRWGRFPFEHLQVDPRPFPVQIVNAHNELYPNYQREIQPFLTQRGQQLKASREAEKSEVATARNDSRDRIQTLGLPPSVASLMKKLIDEELRNAIRAIRKRFSDEREMLRIKFQVPTWLHFIIRKAKERIQDAVTILAWLRRHTYPHNLENKLIPATGLRTPPEIFAYEGFKSVVSEHGVIEYWDFKGKLAFVDCGDHILTTVDDASPLEKRHLGTALLHADAKWAACWAEGSDVFVLYAQGVSESFPYRTMLAQRWPDDVQYDLIRDGWKNRRAKETPGVPSYQQASEQRRGSQVPARESGDRAGTWESNDTKQHHVGGRRQRNDGTRSNSR